MPAVSIIIPSFNRGSFLVETIRCIQDQTFTDWECIIVNDGSSDNTDAVAGELVKSESRLKYFKVPNGGVSKARNYGINYAEGTYILPLDSDDLIASDYIRQAVTAIRGNDQVKLVYCKAEYIGEQTGPWLLGDFDLNTLARQNMIFCTGLYRRADWQRIGGYDEIMHSQEDWEFWIHLLKDGGDVIRLDMIGFYYRIHAQSTMKHVPGDRYNNMLNHICKKHFDFIVRELGNPIVLANEVRNLKDRSRAINKHNIDRAIKKIKRMFS